MPRRVLKDKQLFSRHRQAPGQMKVKLNKLLEAQLALQGLGSGCEAHTERDIILVTGCSQGGQGRK